MPRNGSGSYSLPQAPFTPGTTISSSAVNSDFSDIATALTASISSDGQTPILAPLKQDSGTIGNPVWTFTADDTAGLFLPDVGKLGVVVSSQGIYLNSVAITATAAVVVGGGSNYLVGDTITLTGGTGVRSTVLTVATLSGSAVATVTVTDGGLYTTAPSNPVGQGSTSGVGSGATFTLTTVSTSFAITDESGTSLWEDLGASAYMAGAMGLVSGALLANYIGAANLAAAITTSLPVPAPQGYLTPTSNVPIIVSDAASATVLYYTPFMGSWAAVHNGANIIPYQFASQKQLTLSTSQLANNIYDVFLAYNSGTPVIGTGPSWSASGGTIGNGTSARGTGAGSTAISRDSTAGLYVNTNSISLIYNTGSGNNTITVAAGQGIYLGTILMDSTNGQITCRRSTGQSRKWSVWNCFNRQQLQMTEQDPTGSWAYATGSVRISRNDANNFAQIITGLQESVITVEFTQLTQGAGSGVFDSGPIFGIGFNSSAGFTGGQGYNLVSSNVNIASSQITPCSLHKTLCPNGQNTFWPLEIGGANATFFGGAQMQFTTTWFG